MKTERLYYDDAFAREFTAQALSCEPAAADALAAPATATASGVASALRKSAPSETPPSAATLTPASTATTVAPGGPPAGALWRVKLDRTAFYPTSGGQPHDTGQLGGSRVVDVVDENDEVIHVVDKSIAI